MNCSSTWPWSCGASTSTPYERREFRIDGVPVPTARLLHIIESKQATGRDKDKLFLATHFDALQQLLKKPDS
jgi:hypothetical protein